MKSYKEWWLVLALSLFVTACGLPPELAVQDEDTQETQQSSHTEVGNQEEVSQDGESVGESLSDSGEPTEEPTPEEEKKPPILPDRPTPPACNQTLCGRDCVNTSTNNDHCGRCNYRCTRGRTCVRGACVCPQGTVYCNSRCVSLAGMQSDNGNCGGCGLTCYNSGRSTCQRGQCVCQNPKETAVLVNFTSSKKGYVCADLNSKSHCGGYRNSCGTGECKNGACTCSQSEDTLCTQTIGTSTQSECANLQSNTSHCGTCWSSCLRTQLCVKGACQCEQGKSICKVKNTTKYPNYYEDICIDLQNDPKHCGTCGTVCGKGQSCLQGVCACPRGQTLCQGACVDLQQDITHCGTCGNRCKGDATCNQGTCSPCKDVCRDSNSKYVCVDKQSDVNHCGECQHTCGSGTTANCSSGQCACKDSKHSRCVINKLGGRYGDKEVVCIDLQRNSQHCGACGNVCGSGSACVKGACVCQNRGETGCQVRGASGQMETQCFNLNTDKAHCGVCNKHCGSSLCVSGVCQCPQGKTSCGGTCVDTATSTQHCGGCGIRCKGNATCKNGVCDSCEDVCYSGSYPRCTNTNTDANHCGYCNAMCSSGTRGCNKGKCACADAKQTACLSQTVGGSYPHYLYSCFDLSSNNQHCGQCRNACGQGSKCTQGKCVCNDKSATQCFEYSPYTRSSSRVCVQLQSSQNHCGACNKACPRNATCTNGSCVCPKDKMTVCSGYDSSGKSYQDCVDTTSDPKHCGGCGFNCQVGYVCVKSICRAKP
ncbi:MAG: hypothetical protein EP343_02985 [Deltaproteobacteria bacterium]|nr:MAG: hypothetical protein EP343_02985 [Deltaproteobacteria bacterium]